MDVSVIIPTYNRLWALPKTIESCRNTQCQTEIIVVDDGSTDGTWEWLQTQPDVISLYQENCGKGWAVNRGFAIAQGEYVRFLDSDDWLCPGAIDRQFEMAVAQDADVVVGGWEVYADDELLEKADWTECDDFIAQQLGECGNGHYSAYLFRRAFIKEIPHRTEFGALDDRQFILEVALTHPKVAIHFQPTLCHRHHTNNRMQITQGMRNVVSNFQHLTIYKKCLSRLAAQGELTPRRKRAASLGIWYLAHWIARTHLNEACEVVDWVYCLNPDFRPPESGLLGWLYVHLGFHHTEKILQFRRALLKLFTRKPIAKIHQFPV